MIRKIALLTLPLVSLNTYTTEVFASHNIHTTSLPHYVTHCERKVGAFINTTLPGFSRIGGECIPYTPLPETGGDQGDHYFLDEFTDEKLIEVFEACKKNNGCLKNIEQTMSDYASYMQVQHRDTGKLSDNYHLDPLNEVDLTEIRTPQFFGQSPYFEPISTAERNTSIVEFTAPRTQFESRFLNLLDPIKLRGWYLQGRGVATRRGRQHPLVIMVSGFNIEITAIHHPDDAQYHYNSEQDQYHYINYPNFDGAKTEVWGLRQWRQYAYEFYRNGFDVLLVDKRGYGISGGNASLDTHEMSEDIFRFIDQLSSGEGLKILTPERHLLSEQQATGYLTHGQDAQSLPVFLLGASQGTIVTSFAMHKKVDRFCNYQLPHDSELEDSLRCSSPEDYPYNIKGNILLADVAGGVGYYRQAGVPLLEAAARELLNTRFVLSADTPKTIPKWPSVFFGRGLWDEEFPAESSFQLYQTAQGEKELAYVRGPHSEAGWGDENTFIMSKKMVRFARRVLRKKAKPVTSEHITFVKKVLQSPPFWEQSSQ